jgi:hypothetical protein
MTESPGHSRPRSRVLYAKPPWKKFDGTMAVR